MSFPSRGCRAFAAIGLASIAAGCGGPPTIDLAVQTPHLAFNGLQSQIININLQRLRTLPFQDDLRQALREDPARGDYWDALENDLQGDPFDQIDTLAIGFHGGYKLDDPFASAVFVVSGRITDPAALAEGFIRFAGPRHLIGASPVEESQYEGVTIYSCRGKSYENPGQDMEYHLAFPSDRLAIVSRNRNLVTGCLDVLVAGDPGIVRNTEWQTRLAEVDISSAIWGAGEIPSSVSEAILKASQEESELHGQTGLTNARDFRLSHQFSRGHEFTIALTCETIEKAGLLRAALAKSRAIVPRLLTESIGAGNWRVPVWQGFLDRIILIQDAATTRISLKIDGRDLEEFVRSVTTPPATAASHVVIPPPLRRKKNGPIPQP